MKAVPFSEHGDRDVLEYDRFPDPSLDRDEVLELVWDGTFEPRIRETLPVSQTARAHELIENREGFGKVVVIPDSEL